MSTEDIPEGTRPTIDDTHTTGSFEDMDTPQLRGGGEEQKPRGRSRTVMRTSQTPLTPEAPQVGGASSSHQGTARTTEGQKDDWRIKGADLDDNNTIGTGSTE
eukprot:6608706-Heterocapsa_arctica.AAC.1